MDASPFLLALLLSALLWGISFAFRARLRRQGRVTMQWSLSGKPNWSAPPWVAMVLTPLLGTGALIFVASLIVTAPPAGGTETAWPVLLVIGLSFAAIHAAHLWFATRTANGR